MFHEYRACDKNLMYLLHWHETLYAHTNIHTYEPWACMRVEATLSSQYISAVYWWRCSMTICCSDRNICLSFKVGWSNVFCLSNRPAPRVLASGHWPRNQPHPGAFFFLAHALLSNAIRRFRTRFFQFQESGLRIIRIGLIDRNVNFLIKFCNTTLGWTWSRSDCRRIL